MNDAPVAEERIQNENGPIESNETEIRVRVEAEITDEERLIIDMLKGLMIQDETEEYLHFKKVDQRKMEDVTENVNAVIRDTETDDVTQTNKHAMAAALQVAKEVGKIRVKKGKIREINEPWQKRRLESDVTNRISTDCDVEKLEGKERERLRN